ncbi:hypothetical protein [Bradyrhizobium lablabi]|uniref:hypothetical protein n=1 Tax=Bradyrhizobium lablabi TaxID=722472 RepID=UPI001BAC2864|nr:hypothetical protein [Bradyrhizobium lablabi]MBR0693061.1 hypothetical protein [Bradyrhizobium lablabi]
MTSELGFFQDARFIDFQHSPALTASTRCLHEGQESRWRPVWLFRPTMPCAAVRRETLHPGSLPIYDPRANRQVAGSGDHAGPESFPESVSKSAPANRRAAKTAAISGVTTSTEAAVENTAVEAAAVEAAAAHATTKAATHAPTEATATTARRHNVGCKHSKRRSRQQRDRHFTEHD